MFRNYIEEIKELAKKNVHIKDPPKVNVLINSLAEGGAKKLQVVFDFDRTLTKQHEEGRTYMSSFGVFEQCKSLSNEFIDTVNFLHRKYLPIEINPHISHNDKIKDMHDWWSQTEDALKGQRVSQEEIDEASRVFGPSLRDGTKELFCDLNGFSVPILIFSAGLGDVVVSSLRHFDVLYPDVKVVSNFLKYNEKGVITGFQDSIIHVFNKNEYALSGTPYYDLVRERENVILAGDSVGDAAMVDGMTHCNAVLKIGFLYDHVQENLPKYMDTFDIVLEDDQTMDVIRAVLKCII